MTGMRKAMKPKDNNGDRREVKQYGFRKTPVKNT